MTNVHKYAQWVNDQLDLYNYALRIGDAEWQQTILTELQHKSSFLELQRRDEEHGRLRKEFEDITLQMEAIYSRLREAEDDTLRQKLWERAWRLKKERSRIIHLLREGGEAPGWRRGRGSLRG